MSGQRIPRSIALLNQKGGVGKTELVKGLAAAMNRGMARRILIVDCDPNGDQGLDWGVETDNGLSLARALTGGDPPEIFPVRDGIDLIASGPELAKMIDAIQDPHFQDRPSERTCTIQTISRHALAEACTRLVDERGYEIVLIDTPPGERLIRRLVMAATRYGILVTKPDFASRAGFFGLVDDASRFGGGVFQILGAYIGPTALNATRVQEMNRRRLTNDVGASTLHVFKTSILETKHAREARELGITPFEYIDQEVYATARSAMDPQDRADFAFPTGSALRTATAWAQSHEALAHEIHVRYVELAFGQQKKVGSNV